MKKIALSFLVFLTVFLTSNLCFAVADPTVNGAAIIPSPLTSSTGITASFNTANNGTSTSSAAVRITVSFSLLMPAPTFNVATDITGSGATRFTWVYDPGTNVLTGTLNSSWPAATGGPVIISNLIATGISQPGSEANGINVNVVAPGAVNSSTTNDNTNAYTSAAALPVTLTSFEALREGEVAILKWATTMETNSDYFEIQHSVSGKEWVAVGNVTSNGESSTLKNYTFNHNTPVNGENLYRLKMVDKDQTFAYSRVRSVKFEGLESDLTVYPNPVTDKLFIRDFAQVSQVSIYNLKGQSVYQSGLSKNSEINVNNLPTGVYTVRITRSNGLQTSQKIVVSK